MATVLAVLVDTLSTAMLTVDAIELIVGNAVVVLIVFVMLVVVVIFVILVSGLCARSVIVFLVCFIEEVAQEGYVLGLGVVVFIVTVVAETVVSIPNVSVSVSAVVVLVVFVVA